MTPKSESALLHLLERIEKHLTFRGSVSSITVALQKFESSLAEQEPTTKKEAGELKRDLREGEPSHVPYTPTVAGEGWRLLGDKEIPQEGDEFCVKGMFIQWYDCRSSVGGTQDPQCIYRRRVQTPKQDSPTEAAGKIPPYRDLELPTPVGAETGKAEREVGELRAPLTVFNVKRDRLLAGQEQTDAKEAK